MIPDLPLSDRGWIEGSPQRKTAKISHPPRVRVEKGIETKSKNKKEEIRHDRRQRLKEIRFKLKKSKRAKRKVYKKIVKNTGIYAKKSEEYWKDIIEKTRQFKYQEETLIYNRKQGRKRPR